MVAEPYFNEAGYERQKYIQQRSQNLLILDKLFEILKIIRIFEQFSSKFIFFKGLILVAEPYFNEAGYERQKGTQQGLENSRMYNEMVVLKLVQAMTRLTLNPPEAFKEEVMEHLKRYAQRYSNFGRVLCFLDANIRP